MIILRKVQWLRKHWKLSVQSPVWCVKIAQSIYHLAGELGSELIRRKMTAAAGASPCLSNLGQFSRRIPSFLILFIMLRRWKMSNKWLWFFSQVTFTKHVTMERKVIQTFVSIERWMKLFVRKNTYLNVLSDDLDGPMVRIVSDKEVSGLISSRKN